MTDLSNKEILNIWRKDPFIFIEDIWNLIPQKILPEYEEFYFDVIKRSQEDVEVLDELKLYMFEKFEFWKHVTWQQCLILQAIKDAVNWVWPNQISIKTGHWIWKSSILWKIIIWFLFCFFKSKIWLTAPDSQTLYDSLFSEVWKSLSAIQSEEIKSMFNKTEDYLRVVWAEDEWFARCKTWKKENPEALAWLHAENIALIADEASWISKEIFESWISNLTWKVSLLILIWNPIRNIWYFFDSFWDPNFGNLHFNGEESPITWDYPQKIIDKYWKDSDEYRRRVAGKFPREDVLDDKWYVQLLTSDKIRQQPDLKLYGTRKILWVDCAWQWKDLTTWVLRDSSSAIVVWSEKTSDEKTIAQKTLTIMNEFWVKAEDVVIDNFWVWANVAMHLALLWYKTTPIYVWSTKVKNKVTGQDEDIVEKWQRILNMRALLYWRLKKWIEWWALLGTHSAWKELEHIRYCRTLRDQIQIMSKKDMKKLWYKSPDYADALSLTFYIWVDIEIPKPKPKNKIFRPNYEDYY